jgi:tripartite-type tricarboxylate transporter receptor subunit TctC
MQRRQFLGRLASLGSVTLAPTIMLSPARADTGAFPERPVRMVVPYSAGASTDQIARAVAEHMGKRLGQPVIVENKPGANAIIGATAVAKSAADGYTILFASDSALVLNPLLYKKIFYEPARDFAALGLVVDVPMVMLVHPAVPAKDLAEFVAYAKKNPDKLNFGSTGMGGAFHLAGELFKQRAGIEMTHVPYAGGAPAISALMGGTIQVMFGIVGSSVQYVQAGRLRALAVVGRERVSVLPGVPTLVESGYPNLDATIRYGIVAPKATPQPVLAKLNDALNAALGDAGFRKQFENMSYVVPKPHTGADYDKLLAQDRQMWGELIRKQNLQLD